ncbi:hypothetical protein [Leptospira kirschneri]|uniref:hypothetical protein n=1 Tax=Leptospira kirschneri TaxID=29507 RepID=UPI0009E3D426
MYLKNNRVVKKFYSGDSQNCFHCPSQCNGNRWRIHFSTTLFYLCSKSRILRCFLCDNRKTKI